MGPLLGVVNVLLVTQAMQGAIVGRVTEAESGQPIAGAVVSIADVRRSAAADDSGNYVLPGILPGTHQITVRFVGYAAESLQGWVPDGGRLEIDFRLRRDPFPMRPVDVLAGVIVPGFDGSRATLPDRVISSAAMRNDPRLAEPDALQALQSGEVALREEAPSGASIRGGASDQTTYLLDGIPVFAPYHAAGIASGWNPDALSNVRASSAMMDQPNALAGSIEGTTRAPGDRLRSRGSVSTSQWRLTMDGPLSGAGYLVSLRSGLPHLVAPRDESSYIRGDIGDWLAKVGTPALGGQLQVLGYGNENDLNSAVAVARDEGGPEDPRRNTFEWNGQSIGARWTRAFASGSLRVVGWRADGGVNSTWEALTGPLEMSNRRRDQGVALAVDHRSLRDTHGDPSGEGASTTSAQLRIEDSRTHYSAVPDSTSSPAWRTDARVPLVTMLARRSQRLSPFLRGDLGSSITLAKGHGWFAPNARLLWNLSPTLTISGSVTRSHQFAQSLRNAESVVGNVFPADIYLGSSDAVPVARSDLGILAVSLRPGAGIALGLQIDARRSNGLALVAPGESEPFATRPPTIGSGTSQGLSADASLRGKRGALLLNYGYRRSRLKYGRESYVPENAARHTVEGGVLAFPGRSTSIRVGVSATMGRHASVIADGFEWESTNLLDRGTEFGGSPHYSGDDLGEASLPAYYRLDLGARKEWQVGVRGRAGTLALFLSGTNLLGHKNVLTYARNPSTGEIFGIEMRPRAPLVFGLDWDF